MSPRQKKKKRLSEKAMLTRLTISFWTGRVKDNVVAGEVVNSKQAEDKNSGTWWTNLVPRHAVRQITTAYGRCRAVHKRLTLPWDDAGCRILPADMFMQYSKDMREAKDEFDEAVKAFITSYPKTVAAARKRLGGLLDTKKLPSANDIRHRFGVRLDIFPLPDADDFRVDLSDGDA